MPAHETPDPVYHVAHPAVQHHKAAIRHLEHAAEQHREAVVHLERGEQATALALAQQAMASGGEAVAAAHEAVRVHQDHRRTQRP